MGPIYHPELVQGEEAWHAERCGRLTASEMKKIITPTLKVAANAETRSHLYELLAQRITGYVEPQYVSDDMLRGQEDEILAREQYSANYEPATECGFITNEINGVTIGYSPDGLVGDDGLIEVKSRRQKYQIETIIDQAMPTDFVIQSQTGLLVSERKWLDFISYSGGLHMVTIRVYPDPEIQAAIIAASVDFEKKLAEKLGTYNAVLKSKARLVATERRIEQEMFV